MKKYKSLIITVILVLSLLLVGGNGIFADGGTVQFNNLSDGATVSSLIAVVGTITFPDFYKYEIFLKSGHDLIWVANSHSPVMNGNLARLDPRVFQSGTYQVVIRQVHHNSNYDDVMGPSITIDNPNEVPLPYYPEIEPSFLYPSDTKAIVRARNCAGEDFFFDYSTPDSSGDSGDLLLHGKRGDDSICTFADISLRPAQYRGTSQGLAQTKGAPLEFLAEAGKIYELVYIGGGLQAEIHQRGPDSATETDLPTTSKSNTQKDSKAQGDQTKVVQPLPNTGNVDPEPASEKAAPVAPAAEIQPILPVSGDALEETTLFVVIALLFVVALVVGGVLAIRRKTYNV